MNDMLNQLPEKIEARRGGYAVAFIYVVLFAALGFIAKKVGIIHPYVYMGAAIGAVLGGYYLSPLIFKNPIISATKEGLWTAKLQQVPWAAVNDIRIEKTARFTIKGPGNTDVQLIIETTDDQKDSFDVMYLDTGEAFGQQLIRYWQSAAGKK